jgi:hypothetical protein
MAERDALKAGEAFHRVAVQQRDAAWRELEALQAELARERAHQFRAMHDSDTCTGVMGDSGYVPACVALRAEVSQWKKAWEDALELAREKELKSREMQAENKRLSAAIQYEQHLAGRIGTHGPGCETWGPSHYECALRKLEALRADAQRWRYDCEQYSKGKLGGVPYWDREGDTKAEQDAAIDAARIGGGK